MTSIAIEEIPYRASSNYFVDCLQGLPHIVFLDSAHNNSSGGRYDVISAKPAAWLDGSNSNSANLQRMQQWLDQYQAVPEHQQHLPFFGGVIVALGYDYGREQENLPPIKPRTEQLGTMSAGLYLWAIVSDHLLSKSYLVIHPELDQRDLDDIRKRIAKDPDSNQTIQPFQLTSSFTSCISEQAYRQAFQAIKDYIAAGDCYQVNFAQRFSAQYQGSAWQAYQHLQAAAGPYSAYIDAGDSQILSLSPERFLRLSQNSVETKPIKGTIPRSPDPQTDHDNLTALEQSTKDRAENLMIVDLLRNDLGKICETGSVNVEKLFDIESFSNVHHLVSTITGKLPSDKTPLELLCSCFPGGSITGAPKIRAMEIIEELENYGRGIYCGAIGFISICGQMDFNIAIRTLLCETGTIHCWGGGGIVSDSKAELEYQESIDKVNRFFELLGDV